MKSRFPFFKNNKDIIYLDSAASTHMVDTALSKQIDFISNDYSNIHRGLYKQSELSTKLFEESRKVISDFINSSINEIVWTYGTTDGLNILANSYSKKLVKGDIILLTEMEHHANIVPWQQLKKNGVEIKYIKVNNGILDLNDFNEKIKNQRVKVISLTFVSNVTGVINPVDYIINKARSQNIDTIIDAAQAISNLDIDVKKLDCDFLVFSAHKCYGPNGLGVLYGKYNKLKELTPLRYGGDMIDSVTYENSIFKAPPYNLEAGTPNISSIVAFSESIIFLKEIKNVKKLDINLLTESLKNMDFIIIADEALRVPIISFYHPSFSALDIAYYLTMKKLCFRVGDHCAMPFIKQNLNINGTIRFSFGVYNTIDDINAINENLEKLLKRLKK